MPQEHGQPLPGGFGTSIESQITTFANVTASDMPAALPLDSDRSYTLSHNGVDVAGSAATTTIFLSVGTVTASYAAADDKIPLMAGTSIVVGPGLSSINFQTTSGSPTFIVLAGPRFFGRF